MADERIGRALLRAGTHDPPQVSRALGVLLLCGALLVTVQLSLPHRAHANLAGLFGIGGVALVLGSASVIWAKRARMWTVHAVVAAGTTLICLGVYFSGVVTGAYSVLFVWLTVMAASFFSTRAIAAHVAWILLASGVTLAVVERSPVVAPFTRWMFGSFLVVIAAIVMNQIVAGRRSIEEQLRVEVEEKARLQRELEHLVDHDPLTGLANRRRFEQELAAELVRTNRRMEPLSVAALDLNEFKEYNDVHGHLAGDRLLKLIAGAWTGALRAPDLIARLGGDEFMVLLPDCPAGEAERVVHRLCRRVPVGVTCSAGTACWDGRESAEQLLTRADQAMYEAKQGRPAGVVVQEALAVGR